MSESGPPPEHSASDSIRREVDGIDQTLLDFASVAEIRAQIQARLKRNLESLRAHATAFPAVAVLPVEGGWSAVLQVPSVGSEESLILTLLDQDEVLVHPGYFFDFPREAFIVISLLVEPELFDRAIARLLPRVAGRP